MKHLDIGTSGFQPALGLATPRGVYSRHVKRLLDICLVLVALPLVVLVLGGAFLLIRRDGGPAIYRQPRVGRDGVVFDCLKLRTMAVDADAALHEICRQNPALATEWQTHQKLSDDPRITYVGAILRRTSLDELPQVFNVLRGDMSLVGPRPFTTDQNSEYRAAGGHAYYALRPGLTGLWQVEARNQSSFIARVAFDERYATKLGFWYDMGLIVKTVGVVFRQTGR